MNNHKILKNIYIILVFIFLFLPIIVLVAFSFNTSKMNILFEGFTFKWYKILFTNKELLEAFKNTLIVTFTNTIVSTAIGTLAAIGLQKFNFWGKNFINGLLYIPIVIPEIVLGISLLSIYSLLKLELGMGTLILAHISFSIPFVIISVRSSLENSNPFLESAAHDLGANNWNTFWYVIIPNALPGIKSGALLALTLSLDDVVISFFTTGPGSNTLPLKIYSMIKTGVSPDVNALSTLILLFVIIILLISTFIETKKLKKVDDN
jgi:spermidine/putrescine transport system permease protein